MRRLRRFPARVPVSASRACLLALPLALAGCAGSVPLPAAEVGSIDAEHSSAAADGPVAGVAVALARQVGDATAQLTVLLHAFPATDSPACLSPGPCLSPAQEDAIIARAVAEHEMRRP
jgi:hypothetical protein